MNKTKEELMALIQANPAAYITSSLFNDICEVSNGVVAHWDASVESDANNQKIRRTLRRKIKALTDPQEKRGIVAFVDQMLGNGLPANRLYTLEELGFDFKKNEFKVSLEDAEFTEALFSLGTDAYYDYYVVSPAFKGVRKVWHDTGELQDIGFDCIDDFALTVMKFAITAGALEAGHLDKSDIATLVEQIEHHRLRQCIEDLILS